MPACFITAKTDRQLNVLQIKITPLFGYLLLIMLGPIKMGTGLWIVAKSKLAQYFIASSIASNNTRQKSDTRSLALGDNLIPWWSFRLKKDNMGMYWADCKRT